MGQRLSCFGSDSTAERAEAATCIRVSDPFSPAKPRSELGERYASCARRKKHKKERLGEEEASCAGSDVLEDREPTMSCASTPVVSRRLGDEGDSAIVHQSQALDEAARGRDKPASTDGDGDEITTLWGLVKDLLYGEPDVVDVEHSAGASSASPTAVSPALNRSRSRDSMHSHVSSTGTFTAPPL